MDNSADPGAHGHSSKDLDRILARAIELEVANEGRITDDLLRDIAAEVGISKEAIDQALKEERAVPARLSSGSLGDQAARSAGIGLALGVITSLVRPFAKLGSVHVESLLAMAIIALALVALIRKVKGPSAQARYQSASGAIWLGFAAGFLFLGSALRDDMILVAACGAFISATVGGLIVRLGSPRTPPMLPPASAVGRRSIVPVLYARVSRWLGRLLRFSTTKHPPLRVGLVLGRSRT
ncbi:MAG: hypothetical protein SFU84_14590 [Gemmatimonadales bacterium]|nr:hypothetical protein [Gemmatimonadales bacterium]